MEIALAKIVNSLGLLFDIIGAFLLMRFGRIFVSTDTPKQRATMDLLKRSGWLLLWVGFMLQLASNWLPQAVKVL